jgi:hypothetical protein
LSRKPGEHGRRKLRIGKRKKPGKRFKRQTDQSEGIHDAPTVKEGIMVAQFTFEGAPFPGFKFVLEPRYSCK